MFRTVADQGTAYEAAIRKVASCAPSANLEEAIWSFFASSLRCFFLDTVVLQLVPPTPTPRLAYLMPECGNDFCPWMRPGFLCFRSCNV